MRDLLRTDVARRLTRPAAAGRPVFRVVAGVVVGGIVATAAPAAMLTPAASAAAHALAAATHLPAAITASAAVAKPAGSAGTGAGDVWAVGQSLTQALRPSALTERWDGHAWQRVTAAPSAH
jgi:hypothetical protein